jgi:hypothetical protein
VENAKTTRLLFCEALKLVNSMGNGTEALIIVTDSGPVALAEKTSVVLPETGAVNWAEQDTVCIAFVVLSVPQVEDVGPAVQPPEQLSPDMVHDRLPDKSVVSV